MKPPLQRQSRKPGFCNSMNSPQEIQGSGSHGICLTVGAWWRRSWGNNITTKNKSQGVCHTCAIPRRGEKQVASTASGDNTVLWHISILVSGIAGRSQNSFNGSKNTSGESLFMGFLVFYGFCRLSSPPNTSLSSQSMDRSQSQGLWAETTAFCGRGRGW